MNYEDMPLETLESELTQITLQRDALSARAKQLSAALDKKRAVAAAEGKLAAMSSKERAALVQLIQAKGIQSLESFGNL